MKKIFAILAVLAFSQSAIANDIKNMSPQKVVEIVTQKAEAGEAEFQGILGGMYLEGFPTITPNSEIAFQWMEKSADQGFAMAEQTLGVMYEAGIGTPKDYTKAMEYYKKAAEQNWGIAYYYIAMLYFNGLGVEPNFDTASEYMKKSAEMNNKTAQKFIDEIDLTKQQFIQLHETKDAEDMINLQTTIRLANIGYPQKQFELGLFYMTFAPMDENYYDQSLEWIKKASDKGHPKAQEVLKDMIEQKADFGYLKHIAE